MDHLGQVVEVSADFYAFINARSQLTLDSNISPAPNHRNLLTSSRIHGKLYAATGHNIKIYNLQDLRDTPQLLSSESSGTHESNAPVVMVNLAELDVQNVLHVVLLLSDSLLVVLATRASDISKTTLLFLHVTALADGRIMRRPMPAVSDVTAIALSSSILPANADFQLFACMTKSQNVHVYCVSTTEAISVIEVDVVGALTLGLSGGGANDGAPIVAVGTTRGNVILLDATTGVKVGTIVEVESGWLPCNVHFAGENFLFTTYQRDENNKHVMWHLQRQLDGTGSVVDVPVCGHSPLEELCYSTFFDGDKKDETPSVMFWFIEEWKLALVATSKSSDIEIIAQGKDGNWVNYKLGDSKEIVLPIVDGEDTTPIGMAFDLNNMNKIPALDPEESVEINPMPTLIVLTSAGVILSYGLLDEHHGAVCTAMRASESLPALPSPVPEESLPPTLPTTTSPSPPTRAPSSPTEVQPVDAVQPTPTSPSILSIFPSAIVAPSFMSYAPSPVSTFGKNVDKRTLSSTVPIGSSPQKKGISPSDPFSSMTGQPSNVSGAPASSPLLSFQSSTPLKDVSIPAPPPTFSNFNNNLSNPSFSSPFGKSSVTSTPQRPTVAPNMNSKPAFGSGSAPFAKPSASTNRSTATMSMNVPFCSAPSVTPTATTPSSKFATSTEPLTSEQIKSRIPPSVWLEPKLDDAVNAVRNTEPDDSLGAVRSILVEMSEELKVTRHASRAMWDHLDAMKPLVANVMDTTGKELSARLIDLVKGFEAEKKMRSDASNCMKKILKLHRDYETVCMEDSAMSNDSASQQLREEFREGDEAIAKKETELEKTIRVIENKLETTEIERKRRKDPAGTVQMIYSCISLQGLRIKRVRTLLKSMSQRVETDDQNGRRSDLGLSLARLEKLSLGTVNDSKETEKENESSDSTVAVEGGGNFRANGDSSVETKSGMSKHLEVLSPDIHQVLRRLAMRGGRGSITVESSSLPEKPRVDSIDNHRSRRRSSAVLGESSTNFGIRQPNISSAPNSSSLSAAPQSSEQSWTDNVQNLQPSFVSLSYAPPPRRHTPPPPPPPTSSHRAEQQQQAPNGSRSQRPAESFKLGKPRSNVPQESPIGQFGSNSTPPSFPSFQTSPAALKEDAVSKSSDVETTLFSSPMPKANSVASTQNSSAGSSVKPDIPKSTQTTSLPATSSASKRRGVGSVDDHSSIAETDDSLPTIDITSPTWPKSREWGNFSRPPMPSTFRAAHTSSSKASPVKTATHFATMPPDDDSDVLHKLKISPGSAKGSGTSKMKRSAPSTASDGTSVASSGKRKENPDEFQVASLPPDDDDRNVIRAPKKSGRSGSGSKRPNPRDSLGSSTLSSTFAALPPDDDLYEDQKKKPGTSLHTSLPPDKEDSKPRKEAKGSDKKPSAQFASLPPDDATSSKDGDKESSTNMFAALPPDDDVQKKKQPHNSSGNNGVLFFPPPAVDDEGKGGKQKESDQKSASSVPVFGAKVSTPSFSISSPVGDNGISISAADLGSTTVASATRSGGGDPSLGLFGSKLSIGGGTTASSSAGSSTTLFGVPVGSHVSSGGISGFGEVSATQAAVVSSSSAASSVSPFGGANVSSFGFGSDSGAGGGGFGGFGGSGSSGPPSFGISGAGNTSLFSAAATEMTKTQTKSGSDGGGRMASYDGSSSEDSDGGGGGPMQREQGMETTPVRPSGGGSGFGGMTSTPQNRTQGDMGGFGQQSPRMQAFGVGSTGALFGTPGAQQNQQQQNQQGINGNGGSGFGTTSSFGISAGGGGGFGSGASAVAFGESSPFGSASGSGLTAPSALGGFANGEAMGGLNAHFGESNFGTGNAQAISHFGTTASTFGNVGGGSGQSPFGAFGSEGSGAGAGASPFGNVADGGGGGGGGGGNSGVGAASGFGALASSGSSSVPVFGNGQPPSFTSAAFSERRA